MTVTATRHVSTQVDLIIVHVKKDSVEMEQSVQVFQQHFDYTIRTQQWIGKSFKMSLVRRIILKRNSWILYRPFHTDIDECASDIDNDCHINSTCSNTIGSYDCTCEEGFSGNGIQCEGIVFLEVDFIIHTCDK